MQANSPLITLSPSSPSFNSYSSGKLAEIGARVVQEFTSTDPSQDDPDFNIFSWQPHEHFSSPEPPDEDEESKKHVHEEEEKEEEEGEFEFAIVCREPAESPISADDIFYNGQIRPIYPLFNTSLLLEKDEQSSKSAATTTTSRKPARLPLAKLFSEERESSATSCSSSEADDLESVPADTYCVWTPKKATKDHESADACKKSSSTGSSKRWKFRDLLYRSNSDGKDTFVFLTPPAAKKGGERRGNDVAENGSKEGKGDRAVEEHYAKKQGDKRRSFLPYRQDLVGFFSNVNGLSRNLHPF